MVHQGLLTLLWRIVRAFPKETELLTLCTQIVANLSLHPTLHLHIFQSGNQPNISSTILSYLLLINSYRLDKIASRIHAINRAHCSQSICRKSST